MWRRRHLPRRRSWNKQKILYYLQFTLITHLGLMWWTCIKTFTPDKFAGNSKNSVGDTHALYKQRFTDLATLGLTVSDESEVCRGRRIWTLTPGAINPRAATGFIALDEILSIVNVVITCTFIADYLVPISRSCGLFCGLIMRPAVA